MISHFYLTSLMHLYGIKVAHNFCRCRRNGIKSLAKSKLLFIEGSNMAQNDPRCPQTYFFFQNFGVEASKFFLSGKNGAPKSVGRYKKPSKIQTT